MHNGNPSLKALHFYGSWESGKQRHRLGHHKNPGLEIVLVTNGELEWQVEGAREKVKAGMLFYTLPWQEHGGVEEHQPSSEIFYLCIALDARHGKPRKHFGFHKTLGFSTAEERLISTTFTGTNKPHALPAGPRFTWLMEYFFELMQGSGPLKMPRARDALKLLIAETANHLTSGGVRESHIMEAERRVRKFTAALTTQYAEPWTLESMSRACRLGRTQFAQLMKKYTGETPVTHLNRIRIQSAQRLILGTQKPITEIALETGFNSSQYFATVFKEFTGRTPESHRRGKPGF